MNVNGVTQTTTASTNYNAATAGSSNAAAASQATSPSVTVEISESGLQKAHLYGSGEGVFKTSREELERMKAELIARREEAAKTLNESDPFDSPMQILGINHSFAKGSLGETINGFLEGKAVNSSMVAAELEKMLQGTITNPNGTVEERAVNRETALRNAEYMAQNYFEDQEEAKAFLETVKNAAENDIAREKGYNPFDIDWRPYDTPLSPASGIYNAFVKNIQDLKEEWALTTLIHCGMR